MIVGSYNSYLMMYKDVRLVWASKTVSAPIFVQRASFDDQEGLIVTMSDDGFLQISYLGTEQLSASSHAQSLKDSTHVNYEQVNQEHSQILQKIKQHEEERQVEPTDSIKLSYVLQQALEESNEYVEDPKNQIAVSLGGRPLRMKIKVTLSYQPGSNPVSPHFKSVQLNIECDKQSVWCENPVH